jgi:hypothetical protein
MQIILHVGQQKTASTTIQVFLEQNRDKLADKMVLYPKSVGSRKANLLNDFLFEGSNIGTSHEKISTGLREEFSGKYKKAIISNENLLNLGEDRGMEAIWRLKRMFGPYASSWRVLAYLRRPEDHIASQYQQKVKGGYTGLFSQFFDERLGKPYYNYAYWLDGWADVFGKDTVEARLFHRRTLQGSPAEDFLQWAGVDREGLSFEAPDRVKESLDPVNTEILRFLRLCQVQQPEVLHGHELKRMLDKLRALDTGDRLRLEPDKAKRLQAQFRADHERLAERYLSPDHAAILLAPPTESPTQSLLDHDALFKRMMILFNDPALARMAVENAERPADILRGPRRLTRARGDTEARGVEARYQREARKRERRELQNVAAGAVGSSTEKRHEAGGLAQRTARVFRRIKDRLLGAAR